MDVRRARRRQRHRRDGVGAEARRHGLQRAGRREGAERRRQDDPAQQGLPDARLRELHLDAEDGRRRRTTRTSRCSPTPRSTGSSATATAASTRPSGRSRASSTGVCAPAAGCASWRARWPCPTSSTASWSHAGPRTSPFPQAVPQKALIERAGTSPCTFACPAGIKAHGYVSLVRSGEYEKAFELVLETTPLVGSLGRACYAPCEGECTRGEPRGPAADPPAEALRRRQALRACPSRRRSSAAAGDRQARRDRRLRPGRA